MERVWNGPEDTFHAGWQLGKVLSAHGVSLTVRLYGDLGAGKTLFCSGVVEGLGGKAGDVSSPTFVYMQEYPAPLPVKHLDLYRVESGEVLEALGLADALTEKGITLVEWPEVAEPYLPQSGLSVNLSREGDGRRLTVQALDGAGAEILAAWEAME